MSMQKPLIKYGKVRKAIRAWAEANDLYEVLYDKEQDCLYSPYGADDHDISYQISFDEFHLLDNLESRKIYTVDELCGVDEDNA